MTVESRINEELLSAAVANDDLNDALFAFQQAIGVDDGGVAAAVFSGGWDEEWPFANAVRRREMMDRYVSLECFYAPSADDSDPGEAVASPAM
jgi:hypothetical protein